MTIGPAELKAKLDAGAFGAVVDVRRREEWDAGHIAGATLLASFNTAGFSAAGNSSLLPRPWPCRCFVPMSGCCLPH